MRGVALKRLLVWPCALLLSGCFAGGQDWEFVSAPGDWFSSDEQVKVVAPEELQNWWENFKDPTLNQLVDLTLAGSPERKIAEARILEARGERKTARSAFLPQIGGSVSKGREDSAVSPVSDFYDASFDASFEIDLFGKNYKRNQAANEAIEALEQQYRDVTLSLIAEVVRTYVELRAAEKQVAIANKNLDAQESSLKLVEDLLRVGEGGALDVERAKGLVNTTRASIPEYERLYKNARLRLTILTGLMPEKITAIIPNSLKVPGADLKPLLAAPADVLALRPDIRAATHNLAARTSLAEAATRELFPTISLSGFFGVSDSALANSVTIWNVALGAAAPLLTFGKIEGQIDAARAREAQAYQQYRLTVLSAVNEVETALVDYAKINEQQVSLKKAFSNAGQSYMLSENLYKEGEVSFLDVLDAQRTLNNADSALVSAEAAQAQALVRLYKSLGVY